MKEKAKKTKEKKTWHFEVQARRMLRSKLSRIILLVGILLFAGSAVLFYLLPWGTPHTILLCASPICIICACFCDFVLPRKITKLSEKDTLIPDLSIRSNIYGNAAAPQIGQDALRAIREHGEPIENGEELAIAGYEENLKQMQQEEERRKHQIETDYQKTKTLFSELFQGCELKKEKMHPEKMEFTLHYLIDEFRAEVTFVYQGGETFDVRIKETGVGGITVKYEMNERIPFDGTAENDNIRTALQKLKEYWEC